MRTPRRVFGAVSCRQRRGGASTVLNTATALGGRGPASPTTVGGTAAATRGPSVPSVAGMTTTTVTVTAPAVALRGISRTYGRGAAAVRAVDDVTVDFPRGGWTAVMGPSGSGKSTLLHCAAGLERVDAGQVFLGGTDITAAGDRELTALRRSRIGFVFQSFNL